MEEKRIDVKNFPRDELSEILLELLEPEELVYLFGITTDEILSNMWYKVEDVIENDRGVVEELIEDYYLFNDEQEEEDNVQGSDSDL